MAHVGNLRDYEFLAEAEDIRGSNLFGQKNQKLGTIDDVIFDHSNGEIRYLVVMAEGWLNHQRFLVPGEIVTPSAEDGNHFFAPLTQEQVQRLPAYSEKVLERNEDWTEYEQKYSRAWEEDPVMHIKDTDRVLIPLPGVGQPSSSAMSARDAGTAELRSPAGTPPSQASARTTEAVRQRWQVFESKLRNNREEILSSCGVCNPQSGRKKDVA